MIYRTLAVLLLTIAFGAHAQEAQRFETLAQQCAPSVHPSTLAAVVHTESGFRPYAININGARKLPRQPANSDEAIATAEYLLANGYNFDSGLGQINSANVRKFGMKWADVFEPCANLSAAARVLTECFVRASDGQLDQQTALRNALSCYNTGSFTRGHTNGYVGRVERSAGTNPAPVVPALLPDGQSPETTAATGAGPSSPPQDEGVPDAFGRARLDAFKRAAAQARMERELLSGPATAETVTEQSTNRGEPIKLSVSGGQ